MITTKITDSSHPANTQNTLRTQHKWILALCASLVVGGAVNVGFSGPWLALPFAVIGLRVAWLHSKKLAYLSVIFLITCSLIYVTRDKNPLIFPILWNGRAISKKPGCVVTAKYDSDETGITYPSWSESCDFALANTIQEPLQSNRVSIIEVMLNDLGTPADIVLLAKQNNRKFLILSDDLKYFQFNRTIHSPIAIALAEQMWYPIIPIPIAILVALWLSLDSRNKHSQRNCQAMK